MGLMGVSLPLCSTFPPCGLRIGTDASQQRQADSLSSGTSRALSLLLWLPCPVLGPSHSLPPPTPLLRASSTHGSPWCLEAGFGGVKNASDPDSQCSPIAQREDCLLMASLGAAVSILRTKYPAEDTPGTQLSLSSQVSRVDVKSCCSDCSPDTGGWFPRVGLHFDFNSI